RFVLVDCICVSFLLLSVALNSSCELRATSGGEEFVTTVILESHAVQKPRINCELVEKRPRFLYLCSNPLIKIHERADNDQYRSNIKVIDWIHRICPRNIYDAAQNTAYGQRCNACIVKIERNSVVQVEPIQQKKPNDTQHQTKYKGIAHKGR